MSDQPAKTAAPAAPKPASAPKAPASTGSASPSPKGPRDEIITIEQHIIQHQRHHPGATGEFSLLLSGIIQATKMIAASVRRAGLTDIWGAATEAGQDGHTNVQGEVVQKLDIFANEILKRTLSYGNDVGIIASEEDNEPKVLQEARGKYVVMFDPLDGSSNIDVNVSVGTIFTILERPKWCKTENDAVLQEGFKQVAAGYVLYGPSTVMVLCTGGGVDMYTLEPSHGSFMLTREGITMPEHYPEYSCNEAYCETFDKPYQDYLNWAKGGKDGSSKGFSLRYVGSLVADFHRILSRGGVFLYPPTKKNPEGKLRLMYEANPLAYIAHHAGGMASDGKSPILEKKPAALHARTPLIIGSKKNVEEVLAFVNGQRP